MATEKEKRVDEAASEIRSGYQILRSILQEVRWLIRSFGRHANLYSVDAPWHDPETGELRAYPTRIGDNEVWASVAVAFMDDFYLANERTYERVARVAELNRQYPAMYCVWPWGLPFCADSHAVVAALGTLANEWLEANRLFHDAPQTWTDKFGEGDIVNSSWMDEDDDETGEWIIPSSPSLKAPGEYLAWLDSDAVDQLNLVCKQLADGIDLGTFVRKRPRYRPSPCPNCGGKRRVVATRPDYRHLTCPACGYEEKPPIS